MMLPMAMMGAAPLSAMVLAWPLAMSGPGHSHTPVGSFPEIPLVRGDTGHEWPFSVEEGRLACVNYSGQKVVIFSENWRTDVPQEFGNMTLPRSVIVSANPISLFASIEDRALYAPYDSLATLIKRLAPYERMGWELCDKAAQPQDNDL